MTVPISTGCCMPEPDSGTRKVTSKPFGWPASFRSALALSGSYGYRVVLSSWKGP